MVTEHNLRFKKVKAKSFDKNPYDNFCGIEIECVNRNLNDKELNGTECRKFGFSQKNDGSLGGNGAEFASLAFNGDTLLEQVRDFCKELRKREFYVNKSCGLHIHIGMPQTLDVIKNASLFYTKYQEYFFDMVAKGRKHNSFCRKLTRVIPSQKKIAKMTDIEDFYISFYGTAGRRTLITEAERKHAIQTAKGYAKYGYHEKRYSWVNFHSLLYRGTFEIRLFGGSVNYEKINNWLLLHLKCMDLIQNLTYEQIESMPVDREYFLGLFNNKTNNFILNRWASLGEEKTKQHPLITAYIQKQEEKEANKLETAMIVAEQENK